MDALLAKLDAALAARKILDAAGCTSDQPLVRLWPDYEPDARLALELHASAHGLTLHHGESRYDDGTRIRTVESAIPGGGRVAAIQFLREPIPLPSDVDCSASWSPAHGDKQLLEVVS